MGKTCLVAFCDDCHSKTIYSTRIPTWVFHPHGELLLQVSHFLAEFDGVSFFGFGCFEGLRKITVDRWMLWAVCNRATECQGGTISAATRLRQDLALSDQSMKISSCSFIGNER